VAVGTATAPTNTILYSDDGISWNSALSGGFSGGTGNGIYYNSNAGGRWVAVGLGSGANGILHSTDGRSWTTASLAGGTTGFTTGANSVTYNGSTWMAVGTGGNTILTSSDGITWSKTTGTPPASSYSDVIYDGINWVVVGGSSAANSIIYSANGGTSWTSITLGGFSGGGRGIVWNGSYYVAVGVNTNLAGTIQFSLNLTHWYNSFTNSFNVSGYGISWSDNYFVAVGQNTGQQNIMYSADGKNWVYDNITGNNLTVVKGILYSRGINGPLYALSVSGDAFIDGNLYINGIPITVNGLNDSVVSAGGSGGSGSSLPVNVTNVSSMLGQFSSIGVGVKDPLYHIDVNGSINATSNIFINGSKLLAENSLVSSIEGLGSLGYGNGYISSLSLQSTVQSFTTSLVTFQAGINCVPQYALDVNGDINFTGSLYNNGITFEGGGGGSADIPGINTVGNVAINKLNSAGGLGLVVVINGNSDTPALDVSGNTYISGDVLVNKSLTVRGDITANRNLIATSNVTVSNLLTVNSNTILGGARGTNIVVTTLAGITPSGAGYVDGDSTTAKFDAPQGVAVSSDGTIYVADKNNNRIRKITPQGIVTTFAGQTTAGNIDGIGAGARFNSPSGVAVGKDGNIYVADSGNNRIRRITPGGVVLTLAGDGSTSIFDNPTSLAVAPDGNVYVADSNNHRIRRVTPQGVVTTIAGVGLGGVLGSGYLDSQGVGTDVKFNNPTGVAVSDDGNLYVTDSSNNRIRKIVIATQVVTTLAGSGDASSEDGTGASAKFYYPVGVSIGIDGNIYVSDLYSARIRKVTTSGIVTTISIGHFNSPTGIAIGSDGTIYVADTINDRIRKIDSGFSKLDMLGNAYFTNFITAGGNVNVNGGLDVSGNAYFRGFLTISNEYDEAKQTPILGTGVGQRMTSGIKVGNLHIGAGYPTNGPVIWSETGLTIQGSNGIVGIPRNNLYVGGNVGIGKDPTQYALDVNGSIYASVDVLAQSDIRVKTNIVEIDSPLEKILKMRGVYYNRRDDSNATPARHVGVIAQEVEEVLPEVVSTDNSEAKHKSVAYGNIVALLIEAVKAQQSTIDSLLLTR